MATRLSRIAATAGATALLAGVGAVAAAGPASAASAAPAAQARSAATLSQTGVLHTADVDVECWENPADQLVCVDLDGDLDIGLLGIHLDL